MKKRLLIPIFLLIFGHSIFAQKELTETEKLATTAKIWGFLKYYHPEVANGEYNWDEGLFKVLPKVKAATNDKELSQVYIDWIESLGKIKPCNKCDTKKDIKYFDKNFDLNWINNKQIFTTKLSEKLKYIELNRHQGKKKYAAYYKGSPKMLYFSNEVDYNDFDWQNDNLRLLSLFRYWNMVEYFFPAKYQIDKSWNDVLYDMIPKFLNPKSEIDFHLTMLELVVNLDDSHATFFNKKTYSFFGRYYIPVDIDLIEGKAIVTGFYNESLADLNDLKIGDVITKIEDELIEQKFDKIEKYINGSNLSRKKYNADYYILNGITDSVKIEFIRNGHTKTKFIKRYVFSDFNYKEENKLDKYKILEGNIGYIQMNLVELKEVAEVMTALKNTKAIILDLRNSSKPTMNEFSNYISSQRRDFYKAIFPDLDYPGKFIWDKTSQSGNDKLKYDGKVVLLVSEKCQSQDEFTTMSIQSGDNVTTIGSKTSGANGNVIKFNIVGGFKTQMSGIGIFYPDGTEAQRNGVKIDIEVNPTIEGIIAGKDEILEKAIEFANE